MIIIKRDSGAHMYLMSTVLREVRDADIWRQVRRSELRKAFQKAFQDPSLGYSETEVAGQYGDEPWLPNAWTVCIYSACHTDRPNQMLIGCQQFSEKETAQIRRWALQKRKRKS